MGSLLKFDQVVLYLKSVEANSKSQIAIGWAETQLLEGENTLRRGESIDTIGRFRVERAVLENKNFSLQIGLDRAISELPLVLNVPESSFRSLLFENTVPVFIYAPFVLNLTGLNNLQDLYVKFSCQENELVIIFSRP